MLYYQLIKLMNVDIDFAPSATFMHGILKELRASSKAAAHHLLPLACLARISEAATELQIFVVGSIISCSIERR